MPVWIVQGYATMMAEIEEQLAQEGLKTSAMITPVGVGSLAHAVTRYCESRPTPPSVVAVEPESAPCLTSSLDSGILTAVSTSETIMDDTNCGTVSSTAWLDLRRMVAASLTVSCYESHCAVQFLCSTRYQPGHVAAPLWLRCGAWMRLRMLSRGHF